MKKKLGYGLLLLIFGFSLTTMAIAEETPANWIESITISGAIEVEVSSENDYDDNDSSDIALATADINVDAVLNDWTTGFVCYSMGDDGVMAVDEATITLGNTEKNPIFFTGGKMYVPFGAFESNMLSDPITLDLGEVQDDALLIGAEISGFNAAVYLFNGEIDEDGEDDTNNCFGASVGYAAKIDSLSFAVGADFINSITESGGLGDVIDDNGLLLDTYTAGYAVHGSLFYGPVNFFAEYLAAADDLEFTASTTDAPSAIALEAGYTFEIAGKESVVAAGYQFSSDAGGLLPESRVIGAFSLALADGLGVTLEYKQDTDYDEEDGGTGEDATAITANLALEF